MAKDFQGFANTAAKSHAFGPKDGNSGFHEGEF